MFTASNVAEVVSALPIAENCDSALVNSCCEFGVNWVNERLKDGADNSSAVVLDAMVALAEYRLYEKRVCETDLYDTYSMGDLTFRRDCEKEMRFAKEKRDYAIASAAAYLKDGGFYFGTA